MVKYRVFTYDPDADFERLVTDIYKTYNKDKVYEVPSVIALFVPGNRQQVLLDKVCNVIILSFKPTSPRTNLLPPTPFL